MKFATPFSVAGLKSTFLYFEKTMQRTLLILGYVLKGPLVFEKETSSKSSQVVWRLKIGNFQTTYLRGKNENCQIKAIKIAYPIRF